MQGGETFPSEIIDFSYFARSSIVITLFDFYFQAILSAIALGARVVRLQNIQQSGYDDSDPAYISERHAASLERNRVGGDVLIASLGDDNYPVGRASCYPFELPDAINKADCFRFRSSSRCHNSFVMWFINSSLAGKKVRGFEQSVTMKRINLGNLRRIVVGIPSLNEQLEIADRLTVLSDQDVLLIEQLTKLQSEKSALMNDLLTGRVRVTLLLEGDIA